ncbi:MAG: hypothetical protein QOD49_1958, partial [Actinomycetota bacterium]|nr:hypothetical protein [Actinomycetota bacterium]
MPGPWPELGSRSRACARWTPNLLEDRTYERAGPGLIGLISTLGGVVAA